MSLSVLGGWWVEGHAGDDGRAVGAGGGYTDLACRDDVESRALYDLLGREWCRCSTRTTGTAGLRLGQEQTGRSCHSAPRHGKFARMFKASARAARAGAGFARAADARADSLLGTNQGGTFYKLFARFQTLFCWISLLGRTFSATPFSSVPSTPFSFAIARLSTAPRPPSWRDSEGVAQAFFSTNRGPMQTCGRPFTGCR
jgi:hypothetical protein